MYWYLFNCDEVLPERGFGRISSSTLPFLANITSRNFSPDKWHRLQHLPTLEILRVAGRKSLRTFPEATPRFPSLRFLHVALKDLEILPEWLGQLISLEELRIFNCPKLTFLPASIRNLTALKKLNIKGCPRLVERCQGENAHRISHIPELILNNRRFVRGQPIEGSIRNTSTKSYLVISIRSSSTKS